MPRSSLDRKCTLSSSTTSNVSNLHLWNYSKVQTLREINQADLLVNCGWPHKTHQSIREKFDVSQKEN